MLLCGYAFQNPSQNGKARVLSDHIAVLKLKRQSAGEALLLSVLVLYYVYNERKNPTSKTATSGLSIKKIQGVEN